MTKIRCRGVGLVFVTVLAGCSANPKVPLVDPSVLGFPLVEAGALEIAGNVVGQPRARDGIVYFATREGFLTAAVVPSAGILWRFRADNPITTGPELGEGHVILQDAGNTLYVLDARGSFVFKKRLEEAVTTAVREGRGRLYFGSSSGKILALDLAAGGAAVWEHRASAAITAGPVFAGELMIFGDAEGRLMALDQAGKLVWEFAAAGAIAADPAAVDGRLYFGTKDRFFFCLNAATGKKIWSRRLQGAPLHPPIIRGKRLAVTASNSIVYFLSRRGGSILSWEAVPSRIVYEPSAAGPSILISSAAEGLLALDFSNGKRIGQHIASGALAAGALWVSPSVVVFEEDQETGRQRLVFLRPQRASVSAVAEKHSPGL